MTERLRDLFGEMLAEEPALHVTPREVVGGGRRLRRRRQNAVRAGSGLAAAVVVLAGVALTRGGDAPVGVPRGSLVPAALVYVAPGGHDDAAGTREAPLASVAAAVRRAPAGGTVVLRAGFYRDAVGTVGKRLTIEAFGGERAELTGALRLDPAAAGSVLRGLAFTRASVVDAAPDSVVERNRFLDSTVGLAISGADRVRVVGNEFGGNGTHVGVYGGSRGVALTGNTFMGGTGLLLDTDAGPRVSAAGRFAGLAGNRVAGTQVISWCGATCVRYPTLGAFAAATGLPFGTAVPGLPSGAAPTSPGTPRGSVPPTSPGTPPPARQYLADPGFELLASLWRALGPATALLPVPLAHTGLYALQVTELGPLAAVAGVTDTSATLRTVAGHRYAASCWVRSGTAGLTSLTARLELRELTPAGRPVAAAAASAPLQLTDPTRWYRLAVTYTAAKPGNQLPLSVYATSLTPGGAALLVDDCSLTDG